ncbi:hypothetical protein AX774_g2689 [Zancudomyces culisetae]|uniref:Uncharacterized protein n=1 Tax=Zancudomyces culisetae TaxID=1213189 RepID=A0A1R1PS64_ZANCU|nr:hypothetical protein AX774_g2689 [Zancudomyces culisetae]|eukprot:OMH83807.1 hypothetical protein AX774_g2689 [Zancudomyces culisetae]
MSLYSQALARVRPQTTLPPASDPPGSFLHDAPQIHTATTPSTLRPLYSPPLSAESPGSLHLHSHTSQLFLPQLPCLATSLLSAPCLYVHLGSVADNPTSRTASCVCSIVRNVLATIASSTGPRVSCNKCTSSIITNLVTITCVASNSARVCCTSPVNSLTCTPNPSNRLVNPPAISATNAFIGAIYTTLLFLSIPVLFPFPLPFRPNASNIVNIATFVFPAPVGAHTNIFSCVWNAVLNTLL